MTQRFYTKACCFLIAGILISLLTQAQWYDPDKVNKKARDIYGVAFDDAMAGNYEASLQKIEAALKIEPKFVEAYLSRAGVYAEMRNYKSSVADFEKGFALDAVFASTYLLPYSISLAGTGQFDRALTEVNKFLATPGLNQQSIKAGNYRKSTYEFALDYATKHPAGNYTFAPVNLGDSVNTKYLEYYPSLTIDGKKLIFTRRVNDDEDFYESDLIDEKWSKAKPVEGKINTNFNEGAQNISQDGQWLIFAGCNYPEGQGSCDLYIAYKMKNGKWTEPENLGPIVNTDYWESSPSLSPDKRDLYFCSNMPGGYGGKDIWVTHRTQAGKWSRPENLGPEINTNGDDACPFIHADNQTLYFNSNGHTGYGSTDLYVSRKINDSTWSEPVNLGYPVNTIDDEGSLIVAADGKTAYYASDGNESRGGLDLCTFNLRDEIRAAKTLWVKGRVYDNKTKNGLPSTVELTDLDSRNIISKLQTDEEGNYLVTLPEGKDYVFNVNRKGYLFYSDNFSLLKNLADSFFVVDIPLQPIEAGAAIVLKNIFFDNNKSALKPASLIELDKVVGLLTDNPKLTIQISGHTDNVGKEADNLTLSLNRAKSVTNYIISKGIDAKRITSKGFGAAKPVAGNETEEGKAMNRRTELNVISNK
ncbi:MAG: PD40 domain-containing protein [Bacteroidetes bacterium]|nr:PD40 domain-containing protein [Bacteroidota bacterium]